MPVNLLFSRSAAALAAALTPLSVGFFVRASGLLNFQDFQYSFGLQYIKFSIFLWRTFFPLRRSFGFLSLRGASSNSQTGFQRFERFFMKTSSNSDRSSDCVFLLAVFKS